MVPAKNFNEAFDQFTQQRSAAPQWLEGIRKTGKERFFEHGLPSPKDEDWQYTKLRTLNQTSFTWAATKEEALVERAKRLFIAGAQNLVFNDGHLQAQEETSSDPGLRILPFEKACWAFGDLVQRLLKLSSQTSNAFLSLNEAFLGDGSLIHVRAGENVPKTLHILNFISGHPSPTACFPRHLIYLEKGAQANVIETIICAQAEGSPSLAFSNSVTDIILEDHAQISYAKFQKQAASHIYIGHTRFHHKAHSSAYSFFDICGAGLSREGIGVELAEEFAESRMRGIFHARERQHADYHVFVDHAASHTKSRQFFKGVAEDQSRGVFNAQIKVRAGLKKIDARQLTKNLLLGPQAEIDAKPTLEIDSDDVKCAHGAAIYRLRADEIWYLETRGIPKTKAESILSAAFTQEVLLDIKDERQRQEILQHQSRLDAILKESTSLDGGLL